MMYEIEVSYLKRNKTSYVEKTGRFRTSAFNIEDVEWRLKNRTNLTEAKLLSYKVINKEDYHVVPLANPTRKSFRDEKPTTDTYRAYRLMREDVWRKGATIAPIWGTFDKFFASAGQCPKGFKVMRRDSSKPYGPMNCVYAKQARKNHYPNPDKVPNLAYNTQDSVPPVPRKQRPPNDWTGLVSAFSKGI